MAEKTWAEIVKGVAQYFFRKAEHVQTGGTTATAHKPILLDDAGHIDASMINDADVDHGSIGGLADDDHTQYLRADGTRALTANWDAGSFEVRAQTFQSDVVTGTAPLIVASSTKVTNLNADLLDGQTDTYYLARANHTGTQLASTISDFDEAAQDAVGGILTDSSRIDFTYTDATPAITADIVADSVSNTYLANMAQATIKGRASGAGTGDPTDLTAAQAAAIVNSSVDHGTLAGLADDDHTIYLKADGSRGLSADWDAGSFEIRAQTLEADVVTGTAPLTIASTTVVTNLNADLLDGNHAAAFATSAQGVTNGNSHDHNGGDGAQIDHGGLAGLSDDDHTQYALLAGRSGGQTLIGGTASGDDLTLRSTSNATEGFIIIGPNADDVAVGHSSPEVPFHAKGSSGALATAPFLLENTFTSNVASTRSTLKLRATTTGDMSTVFGPTLDYEINDSAVSGANVIARIAGVRDGADDNGRLSFSTAAGGKLGEAMRITSANLVGINQTPTAQLGVTSGDAGRVALEVRSAASPSVNIVTFTENGTEKASLTKEGYWKIVEENATVPGSTGATIILQTTEASPAALDMCGTIRGMAEDSTGVDTVFVDLYLQADTVTNGSEKGAFYVQTQHGGTDAIPFAAVGSNVRMCSSSLSSVNFQSGDGIIFIENVTATPSANPSGGGFLYAEAGALKWRGSSGTITTIAPA